MAEFRVPVVVEVILERVTNISMGTELDNVVEFEELADARRARARPPSPCSTEPTGEAPHARPRRPRQVQGIADRARGRRRGSRRGSRPRPPGVDGRAGRRSPTAATARWTPRSRPGTSGSRCAPRDRPASRSTRPSRRATGVAVVEMADVSGLRLLPHGRLAPLTREFVRHRARSSAPRWTTAAAAIVLGIGGSASTDGGAGMLQALGVAAARRGRERTSPRRRRAGRPRPAST